MTPHVLVIGAGGLGCPVLIGLISKGFHTITVADDDVVELSNLARQQLYEESDCGKFKAEQSCAALQKRCQNTSLTAWVHRFCPTDSVRSYDIVIDASDNAMTRFAVNDACIRDTVPLVYGAALGWNGQWMTINPSKSPCLRCIFEEDVVADPLDSCAQAGVFSPLVGAIGEKMAFATHQYLEGSRQECGVLNMYDARMNRHRAVSLKVNPECLCQQIRPV